MLTAQHELSSSHTPSLPTELLHLIAEHVVANNDTEALKSCSLSLKDHKTFFQRAIRAQKPFTIICAPFRHDSKFRKTVTTLLELLDVNPSFGRDCIRDIRITATCSFTLEDPALRLDYILSRCTELQSFTFDMCLNHRDGARNWTTIYRPIRVAMENVLHLPSLRRASFEYVNLPWTTLFRSKKSLDCLTVLSVGNIGVDSSPHIGDGGTPMHTLESAAVSRIYMCPSSAMALVAGAENEAFTLDYTKLETIELSLQHTLAGMGATWPIGMQALLRRARTLRKLVFHEIKGSFLHSSSISFPSKSSSTIVFLTT